MLPRLAVIAIAGILSFALSPVAAAASGSGTIVKGVNFRSAPSVNSQIYGTLHTGTAVKVLDEVNSYWVKVSANGKTGYVSTAYIRYTATSPNAPVTADASKIINFGAKFLGTPYQFGAKYETSGKFDCSSFMQYIFRYHNIQLPRTSVQQSKVGTFVAKSQLRVGDLVFFWVNDRSAIGHVGIYVGNGRMLHASGSDGVTYSPIESGYWKDRYKTARRVL